MNGERLVAEQDVLMSEHRRLSVRISKHEDEDFWRVDVRQPASARGAVTATVSAHDSFLMHLIHRAVGGEQAAWHHLAQWGHTNLTRPATGFWAGLD